MDAYDSFIQNSADSAIEAKRVLDKLNVRPISLYQGPTSLVAKAVVDCDGIISGIEIHFPSICPMLERF